MSKANVLDALRPKVAGVGFSVWVDVVRDVLLLMRGAVDETDLVVLGELRDRCGWLLVDKLPDVEEGYCILLAASGFANRELWERLRVVNDVEFEIFVNEVAKMWASRINAL